MEVGLGETPCAYNERKVSDRSKLELIHDIISQLGLHKDITSRFIDAVCASVDLFDNACSVAEVDHWIARKLMYARCQKAKPLRKDLQVNVNNVPQNNINPATCEPLDSDTGLIQDSRDAKFIEGMVCNVYIETPVTFDSKEEEDTDSHRIDVCGKVDVQDLPC